MKKFKSLVTALLMFCICFSFGGCFLKNLINSVTLADPVLEIDTANTSIKWVWDMDAESYKLYDNSTLVDTFTVTTDPINKYTVNFSKYLTEYKEYNFKIVAYINDETYKESNFVTYLHQNKNIASSTSFGEIVNKSNLAPTNLTYSNYTLTWNPVEDATKYYVTAIYSANNYYTFETTETSANVFNYLSQTITAFRVGSNFGDNNTYFGDMVTVNVESAEDIYRKTYFFNGEFNDYYVNSSQEFIKVLYYSFIAKDVDVHVKFSPTGLTEVMGGDNYLSNDVLQNYINAITETCYYSFASPVVYSKYKYKFTFDYKGVTEPNRSSTNVTQEHANDIWVDTNIHGDKVYATGYVTYTLTQSEMVLPYYNNYTFTKRDSDTVFKSDNNLILVNVESSDELYWCIEGGATPVFNSTNSSAYTLYNSAKTVLTNVVSNSMTLYEKILSIYDFICVSSIYDYQVVEHSAISDFNPTAYYCFYIESLLNNLSTKLAVCDGYSKTFSLLCNMEGIPCYRVTGVANTGGGLGAHAWNKVKYNNNWYIVDITWTEFSLADEAVNTGGNLYTQDKYEVLGHKYFLVNENFIESDHFAYSDADDRQRFKDLGYTPYYNSLFPAVYLETAENSCNYFYDYYSNTNLGTVDNVSVDRYIKTYNEAVLFLEYIQNSDDTNLEILISGSIADNVVMDFLQTLASSDYGSYSVYKVSTVNYASTMGGVSGSIYIITTLD